MPQKKNLSEEELEEIRALRGSISVEDAKRKYGIGAGRLYRIWKNSENPVESTTQVEPYNLDAVTPVMIAADHGYVDMVELLVREGADVSLEDAVGNNILHKASRGGHLETVKYILTKGMVSIDSRGQYKLTPVMMAAEYGHKAVVELFVEKEANLSQVDEFRNTILHRACRGGYLPTVEYILSEAKHYFFTRNGQGRTPVLEAEYKGHTMVVTFLKAEM